MRRSAWFVLLVALSLVGGCEKNSVPGDDAGDKTVKFIMSDAAFNSEVVPILKQEMARQGFVLDWMVVNDIIQPNEMVDSGSADANSFQHEPYFDQFVIDHHLTRHQKGLLHDLHCLRPLLAEAQIPERPPGRRHDRDPGRPG